jgi:tetratricopeptide (TPR) repeat protein
MKEEFESPFEGPQDNDLIKRFEEMLEAGEQYFFDVEEFDEIISYYMEERASQRAFEVLSMAKSQHPATGDLILREAELLAATNRFQEALSIIGKLEQVEKWNTDLFLTKASILSQIGNNRGAINTLEHVLTICQDDEKDEICINIAFECQNLEKPEEAIHYLKRALTYNPQNEEAIYEIAYCYDLIGENAEAIETFVSVIDETPYSHHAWYCLGNVYLATGAVEDALRAYDYSVVIQDDFASGYFNKAMCLMQLEHYEQAIECFRQSLNFELIDSVCLYYIGECYLRMDEDRQAEIHFRKAIAKDERLLDAWVGMATVLYKQNKTIEALHYIKKAIKLDEHSGENWYLQCEYQLDAGLEDEACNSFERALENGYNKTSIWLNYSEILVALEQFEKAEELLNKALETCPKDSEIHYRYVAYLLIHGRIGDAEEMLLTALELNSKKVESLLAYYPEVIHYPHLLALIDSYQ